MLIAHLVPGYFAAQASKTRSQPNWNAKQRRTLWAAALISAFVPDFDVIFNALFRGFVNHSVLWTHSLFIHLAIAGLWWMLPKQERWAFVRTLIGLVAVGGLSHLLLDVIAHGTPLFYPFSLAMIGLPSDYVLNGGLRAYLTDPIFLLEPVLLTATALHFIHQRPIPNRLQVMATIGLLGGLLVFALVFLTRIDDLRQLVAVASFGGK